MGKVKPTTVKRDDGDARSMTWLAVTEKPTPATGCKTNVA